MAKVCGTGWNAAVLAVVVIQLFALGFEGVANLLWKEESDFVERDVLAAASGWV